MQHTTIQEQAVDWAIRLHDGDLTAAERQALDEWVSENPEHAAALERARRLLGDTGSLLVADPGFTRRQLRRGRTGGIPTVTILLASLIGGGLFVSLDGLIWLKADVTSAASETPVITLTDGSRVHLNGKSAIAEHFSAGERRIELLKGEAYFEVTEDVDRPFIVQAGGGEVKVTGTAFDVNLVDGGTEVAVTQHGVVVTGRDEMQSVRVEAGEAVFYDTAGAIGSVETLPADLAAPWRSGRLVFERQRLASVAAQIFRHIPGRVVVARPSIANKRISGSFDLSNPADALASFGEVFNVRIVRAGDLLTIIY